MRVKFFCFAVLLSVAAGCGDDGNGSGDLNNHETWTEDTVQDVPASDVVPDTAVDTTPDPDVGDDASDIANPDVEDTVGDTVADVVPDTSVQEKMDKLFEGIREECRPVDLGCADDSECEGGLKCVGTRCVAEVAPTDYQFSSDAFAVVALAVPSGGSGSGFDLNGDGTPDNLLADTIATYPGGTDLVNWTMKGFVESGGLGLVFEMKNVPSDGCGPVEMAIHRGTSDLDRDGVPEGNTFEVRPDSFREDGFGPTSQFNTAAMDGGRIVTGEGVGIPLVIVLPDGSALDLMLEGARIDATMETTPQGVRRFRMLNVDDAAAPADANAKIGGYIRVSSYSDSMNRSARGCSCANVNPDVPVSSVTVVADALQAQCDPSPDVTACTMDTDGRVCVNLSGSCTALWVMGGLADVATGDTVDSKGKPIKDAVSVALYVTLDAAKFAEPPLAPDFQAVGDTWRTQNDADMIRNNIKRRIGVLANDFYDSTVSPVITAVTQGQHGTVDIGLTGDYVYYTPVPGYTGFDRFTYTISDGKGNTDSASVDVRMSPMVHCQEGWTIDDYCQANCMQEYTCDPDTYSADTCFDDCVRDFGSTWISDSECAVGQKDRVCCRLSIPCAQWKEFKEGEAAIQAGNGPANMVCKSQIVNKDNACGSCPAGTWGEACNPCQGNADGPCGGTGICNDGINGDGTCTCPEPYLWNPATTGCELPVNESPEPGSGIVFDGSEGAVIQIAWGAATDDATPAADLEYRVYMSLSNNIGTVSACDQNGTVVMDWKVGATSAKVASGIAFSTPYWFTVVVRDGEGGSSAYTTASHTTPESGNVLLGCEAGYAVVGVYGAAGWWFDGIGIRCSTVTGTTTGPISNGPYVGGTGGSPFTFDCPSGWVLYSVKGDNGTSCSPNTTLRQFYQCIELSTGTIGSWSQQYGGSNLGQCGPTAGGAFEYSCPQGHPMLGIEADAVVNGGSTYVGFTNGVECR